MDSCQLIAQHATPLRIDVVSVWRIELTLFEVTATVDARQREGARTVFDSGAIRRCGL
jgi:hypothetical protein